MFVPFQMETPAASAISAEKMKLHSRDSYQPRLSGDHSKRWTRTGRGLRPVMEGARRMAVKAGVVVLDGPRWGRWGVSCSMTVRGVWRGRSGSQVAAQAAVGSNVPPLEKEGVSARLLMLGLLFCREKEDWLAGSLPLAFSDMPRTWIGTASSTAVSAIDGAREVLGEWTLEWEGVGLISVSTSEEEESSSPMAKVSLSSGTLLRDGARAVLGLRRPLTEPCCIGVLVASACSGSSLQL